jgi:HlyD family secretion protein
MPTPRKTLALIALTAGLIAFGPEAAMAADAMQPSAPIDGPRVTVDAARRKELTEKVIVTGTLVPRDEILVGPEIDGYRIVEILAEDGDKVAKGQVLARLNRDTLETVLAQNDAARLRADAAIAQARSQIAQADAALTQSRQALNRTTQLRQSGFAAQATFDTLTQEERANRARLDAARQGLASAEADKANAEAQRREVLLRLERTEVKAPAAGIVSRRTAKLGAVASMAVEPLFRLIADGDIELEAEVAETRIGSIHVGDAATATVGEVQARGKVRLVSTEIDRATRLGKIRIAIGNDTGLRVGAFARGVIDTRSSVGVAVPLSAVLYGPSGPFVQVVKDRKIVSAPVTLGIATDSQVEIAKGMHESQLFVVKAGAFLRDGDAVQPVDGAGKPVGVP